MSASQSSARISGPAVRTDRAFCPNQCTAVTRDVEHASAGLSDPWRVVRCSACGAMFTNPRPPASDMGMYYPDDYGPYQTKPPVRLGKRISLAVEGWVARVLGKGSLRPVANWYLDREILPPFGTGKMVDIGCGAASYISRLRRCGWDVLGLEPSGQAVRRARERYGVRIINDFFPTAKLPAGGFDLVTAHQVLEHLDHPQGALSAMRDLLKPGGKVLLTVPNAESWSSRHFAAAWIGWDMPRHLTHFTPESLAALARKVGLEPCLLQTIPHGGWMRESAQRALTLRSRASDRWMLRRNVSDTLARYYARRGQGDGLLMIADRVEVR